MATIFVLLIALLAGVVGGVYFLVPGIIVAVVALALLVFVIHQNRCRLFAHNPRAPQWLRAGCDDVLAAERTEASPSR
jgi:hypothetical protein